MSPIDRWIHHAHQGKLHPVLILLGGRLDQKKFWANELMKTLCCESKSNERGCGECGVCLRLARGQSESVLEVLPQKGTIKVEQSHGIIEFLSLRVLGSARGIIIHNAEAFHTGAANAILKILEEPPPRTHFFLFANNLRALLPTVRSRAVVASVADARPSSLALLAEEIQWEEKDVRARGGSRVEQLHRWIQGKDLQELLNQKWEREESLAALRIWQIVLRDALALKHGQELQLPEDFRPLIEWWADHSVESIHQTWDSVKTAEQDCFGNIDRRLLMENLVLSQRIG